MAGKHTRQPRTPSPFESDDEGLDLVALDEVTSAPRPQEQDDDFEVTVEEPDDGLDFELIVEEPAPESGPCRVDDLPAALAALEQATHADEVLDLLAQPVVPGASLVVVFRVRDGVAEAQRACGSPASPKEVQGLVVPIAGHSLLHTALKGGALARGTAAGDHLQQMISRYLRAAEPGAACVAPVLLGKRVVNLVCVQSTTPELDPQAVTAVTRLCTAAAAAYLRLVRELKARRTAQS